MDSVTDLFTALFSPAAGDMLQSVLANHIQSVINVPLDISDRQRIPLHRSSVWRNTLRCMRMSSFVYHRGFNVKFLGKEGVDMGGPLREFFRLVMNDLQKNGALMCGPELRRTAMHNVYALQQREFVYAGQCMALSLLYGGPGPHFFSDTAASYLLDLPVLTIDLEHC